MAKWPSEKYEPDILSVDEVAAIQLRARVHIDDDGPLGVLARDIDALLEDREAIGVVANAMADGIVRAQNTLRECQEREETWRLQAENAVLEMSGAKRTLVPVDAVGKEATR